jgi:uncharacterized protein with HEPN domain
MQSDARKLLYDVLTATATIREFCRGRTFQDYQTNQMVSDACERRLEIIGEAMTRLRDLHPDVFDTIPEGHAVIGLRNRLIHGYDTVDPAIVWDIIQTKLPQLGNVAQRLLDEAG